MPGRFTRCCFSFSGHSWPPRRDPFQKQNFRWWWVRTAASQKQVAIDLQVPFYSHSCCCLGPHKHWALLVDGSPSFPAFPFLCNAQTHTVKSIYAEITGPCNFPPLVWRICCCRKREISRAHIYSLLPSPLPCGDRVASLRKWRVWRSICRRGVNCKLFRKQTLTVPRLRFWPGVRLIQAGSQDLINPPGAAMTQKTVTGKLRMINSSSAACRPEGKRAQDGEKIVAGRSLLCKCFFLPPPHPHPPVSSAFPIHHQARISPTRGFVGLPSMVSHCVKSLAS